MSFVAQDHRGKFILLQSSLAGTLSPEKAEIKTLVWATEIVSSKGSELVEWRCDAQRVVDQIMTIEEPNIWHTINDLLLLRQRFQRGDWILLWTNIEANTKFSLKHKLLFCCFDLFELLHCSIGAICLEDEALSFSLRCCRLWIFLGS